MSHLNLLTFSTDFCPIKYDLSGDTAWTQASGFQKLAKVTIFNELLSIFKHCAFAWKFIFCTNTEVGKEVIFGAKILEKYFEGFLLIV